MRTPAQPAQPPSRRFVLLAVLCIVVIAGWLARRSLHPAAAEAVKAGEPPPSPAATAAAALPNLPAHTLAPRWEEAPGERIVRSGRDASTFYRKAFALFDALSEEEKTMLRKPGEEVDAEQAEALFAKVREIMDLLGAAAQADFCDWGISPLTFDMPMPHIAKGVDLGKLALWAAGYEFPRDPAAAIRDLEQRAQLGHHLGDSLIGVIVAGSFEMGAARLLGQNAALLDAATAQLALNFIGGSAIDQDLTRAFDAEAAMMEETVARLARSSSGERSEMISAIDRRPAAGVEELFHDPVRLAAEVAFIREIEGEMAGAMRLPEGEFQAWWRGMQAQLQGAHPLARQLLPTFESVQQTIEKLRVQRTLVGAGLDILQNGAAQLAHYRDPATGAPLLYFPTSTGFELRAAYAPKGKPVSLTFSTTR